MFIVLLTSVANRSNHLKAGLEIWQVQGNDPSLLCLYTLQER